MSVELVRRALEYTNTPAHDAPDEELATVFAPDVVLDMSTRVFNPKVYEGYDGLREFRADLLEDTYEDERAAGASHEEALARAAAQLPEGEALARRIGQAETPVAARVPVSLHAGHMADRLLRSRRGMLMNSFLQDVKYALRMLAKHPGYTALAVMAHAVASTATQIAPRLNTFNMRKLL